MPVLQNVQARANKSAAIEHSINALQRMQTSDPHETEAGNPCKELSMDVNTA